MVVVKNQNSRWPGVSLFQRGKDGRWMLRWTDPVTKKRKEQALSKLASSIKDRERLAKEKSLELAGLKHGLVTGRMTAAEAVADAVQRSLREEAEAFLADKGTGTAAAQRADLIGNTSPSGFVDWCERYGVTEPRLLTNQKLVEWKRVLRDRALKQSTRNKKLKTTSMFVRHLATAGLTPDLNSAHIVDNLKGKPVEGEDAEIEVLQRGQVQKLLLEMHARDTAPTTRPNKVELGPLLLTLLLGGFRFNEAAELQWSEVDFEEHCVRLPATRTKTRRKREVSWSVAPALGKLLQTLHESRRPGEQRVFPEATHAAWTNARETLYDDHEVERYTANIIRHTSISTALSAKGFGEHGLPLFVAKRHGNSLSTIGTYYAHPIKDVPPAASTVEQALGIEKLARAIVRRAGR